MYSALVAVLGYAIGTAQILFVDWWRRRREHMRHLRLLRAELRQVHERSQARFEWDPVSGPPSDEVPFPPQVSAQYAAVVATTDFYLTDEHDDDNTQQALLNIADGVALLSRYHQNVLDLAEEARHEAEKLLKAGLGVRAKATAAQYDREAARLEHMVGSGLADLDRRLALTGFWDQLQRTVRGRLPPGENPPNLRGSDDPRLSLARPAKDLGSLKGSE